MVSNPPSGFFPFYLYGLSYVARSRFPREKPFPVLGPREGRWELMIAYLSKYGGSIQADTWFPDSKSSRRITTSLLRLTWPLVADAYLSTSPHVPVETLPGAPSYVALLDVEDTSAALYLIVNSRSSRGIHRRRSRGEVVEVSTMA